MDTQRSLQEEINKAQTEANRIYAGKMSEDMALAKDAAQNMRDWFQSAFFDILQGNFKDLATSFKAMVDEMVAKWLAAQLWKLISDSLSSSGWGSILGLVGSVAGGAAGAAGAGGSLYMGLYAEGGIAADQPRTRRFSGVDRPIIPRFSEGGAIYVPSPTAEGMTIASIPYKDNDREVFKPATLFALGGTVTGSPSIREATTSNQIRPYSHGGLPRLDSPREPGASRSIRETFSQGGMVYGPTYFSMPDGRTGLMGEAGPEAVLPALEGQYGLSVKARLDLAGTTAEEARMASQAWQTTFGKGAEHAAVIPLARVDGKMGVSLGGLFDSGAESILWNPTYPSQVPATFSQAKGGKESRETTTRMADSSSTHSTIAREVLSSIAAPAAPDTPSLQIAVQAAPAYAEGGIAEASNNVTILPAPQNAIVADIAGDRVPAPVAREGGNAIVLIPATALAREARETTREFGNTTDGWKETASMESRERERPSQSLPGNVHFSNSSETLSLESRDSGWMAQPRPGSVLFAEYHEERNRQGVSSPWIPKGETHPRIIVIPGKESVPKEKDSWRSVASTHGSTQAYKLFEKFGLLYDSRMVREAVKSSRMLEKHGMAFDSRMIRTTEALSGILPQANGSWGTGRFSLAMRADEASKNAREGIRMPIAGETAGGAVVPSSPVQERARRTFLEASFAMAPRFSNTVQEKPVAFRMGTGFGMLGERGPEAIMPVARKNNLTGILASIAGKKTVLPLSRIGGTLGVSIPAKIPELAAGQPNVFGYKERSEAETTLRDYQSTRYFAQGGIVSGGGDIPIYGYHDQMPVYSQRYSSGEVRNIDSSSMTVNFNLPNVQSPEDFRRSTSQTAASTAAMIARASRRNS
jgi:hypothetical protein